MPVTATAPPPPMHSLRSSNKLVNEYKKIDSFLINHKDIIAAKVISCSDAEENDSSPYSAVSGDHNEDVDMDINEESSLMEEERIMLEEEENMMLVQHELDNDIFGGHIEAREDNIGKVASEGNYVTPRIVIVHKKESEATTATVTAVASTNEERVIKIKEEKISGMVSPSLDESIKCTETPSLASHDNINITTNAVDSTTVTDKNKDFLPDNITSNTDTHLPISTSETTTTISLNKAPGQTNEMNSCGDANGKIAHDSRKRLLSIDVDSTGFDFDDMGMVDMTTSSGSIEGGGSGNANVTISDLPPLVINENKPSTSSTTTYITNTASSTPIINNSSTNNDVFLNYSRERGLSLDFLSFGMNEDEPLPLTTVPIDNVNSTQQDACSKIEIQKTISSEKHHDAHKKEGNSFPIHNISVRPRGDSIIFDPSSFDEGGIHEENALLKTRKRSSSLGMFLAEEDEVAIMNAPGFIEAPANVISANNSAVRNNSNNTSNDDHGESSNRFSSRIHDHQQHSSKQLLSASTDLQPNNDELSQNTCMSDNITSIFSTVSNASPVSSQPPTSSTTLPSSFLENSPASALSNASSTSTTIAAINCQMELINKGGRIGIYLPEARKARIAKFHSKRKMRIWRKRIKYDCRKKLADSRPRIKGRFVKRSDVEGDV